MRRRNGKSPTKGIDTCIFAIDNIDAEPQKWKKPD